jgi:hypothetical protein
MDTVVELLDVNGEWWNLTDGDRGVWLGTDPKGLYDPPVKVVYEEPGNHPGARYMSHRVLRRDIVFGVEILNDAEGGETSWLSRDSEWRKAWAFDRDCKLYVTTQDSGTRYLSLRLGESPEIEMYHDPKLGRVNRAGMVCISGDPFWYEDDVVYSAVTRTDTTFTPSILPWPWPQEDLPKETLYIEVDPKDGRGGLNPTDQPVFLKWGLAASIFKPALPYIPFIPWLGAPESKAVIWTIPDYSFTDPELSNRRLRMPGLIGGLVTNNVQLVTINGAPTGGTFKLTFKGKETANIAYNASGPALQSALEALPNVEPGDVVVTKDANVFTVKFQGRFEGQAIEQMTRTYSLTGGSGPFVSLSTHTEGTTYSPENAFVDTDPRVEQVTSESKSALWSRMNGVRFRHYVPPYTKSRTFEITVSGAVPGQMVTLRIPRPWTRPWGLE